MMRAKNEAIKITDSITSILEVFDEIIVVDNGSSDDTLARVRSLKAARDRNDRIKILEYPYEIARCGHEHFGTPANSIHSLTYYYNWCLSQCTRSYVFKWDADMFLDQGSVEEFSNFLGSCVASPKKSMWKIPLQTVYRSVDDLCYLFKDEINAEVRLFPNDPRARFFKGRHFEILEGPGRRQARLHNGTQIFEIKDLGEDEFSHWSDTDFPSSKKQVEWEHFFQLKDGDVEGGAIETLPGARLRIESVRTDS